MLTLEEMQSMTVWGDAFSAQVRDGKLALFIREDAPRDEEGTPLLHTDDVRKLRGLLLTGTDRGEF